MDLDPASGYRASMAKLEWSTRFQRLAEKVRERDPANPFGQCQARPEAASVNLTDAVQRHRKTVIAKGVGVQARADERIERRKL